MPSLLTIQSCCLLASSVSALSQQSMAYTYCEGDNDANGCRVPFQCSALRVAPSFDVSAVCGARGAGMWVAGTCPCLLQCCPLVWLTAHAVLLPQQPATSTVSSTLQRPCALDGSPLF
ncbi:hypothetical protein COO60DRAFT_1550778 [Scenedesmus sp. NREL 46B-D3]|nr:hypothetical protein COO60DRAFT_1550778 [Scenedesmus sp. NREL 46B-D3]